MRRWPAAAAAALLAAACGSPRITLPSGPGVAAPDAGAALLEATAACREIRTISAEVNIAGRVGGQRLRGRMLAGLAAPDSVYLDVPAPFGASVFILGGRGDSATLLLPRDRRVIEDGRPAEILEAIAGVFLGPEALREVLTGCAPAGGAEGRAFGDDWRLVPGAADRYLRREKIGAPWRLQVVVHPPAGGRPGWRVEYREFAGALPRSIRLASADGSRFDIRLTLSQVEIGAPLGPATFEVDVPAGFAPLTIDELRDAGPLAARE